MAQIIIPNKNKKAWTRFNRTYYPKKIKLLTIETISYLYIYKDKMKKWKFAKIELKVRAKWIIFKHLST